MKKLLAAAAVLGALAGTASAADVQIYGVADEGLAFERVDKDYQVNTAGALVGVDSTSTLQMKSGIHRGSRWGLKGSEKVADDLSVSFILESGFNIDSGTSRTSGSTFDREASLNLSGSWGKFSAGKIGSINQGTSSWSKIGRVTAFGNNFGNYAASAISIYAKGTVMNNTIAYETPKIAGFQAFAQYSFGTTGDGSVENTSQVDRYGSIGATYNNGPLDLYLAFDYTNYQSVSGSKITDMDDAWSIIFGGSCNFDVVRIYAGAQYFDNTKLSSVGSLSSLAPTMKYIDFDDDGKEITSTFGIGSVQLKGWSASLTAGAPIAGGTGMIGVAYIDAESCSSVTVGDVAGGSPYELGGVDVTRFMVTAGYTYPFSKRTNLYAVASYVQDKYESRLEDIKPSAFTAVLGLSHRF